MQTATEQLYLLLPSVTVLRLCGASVLAAGTTVLLPDQALGWVHHGIMQDTLSTKANHISMNQQDKPLSSLQKGLLAESAPDARELRGATTTVALTHNTSVESGKS